MNYTIAIGADHRGFHLKEYLCTVPNFGEHAITWQNVGTDSEERTDYPIYTRRVVDLILKGEVSSGILICGSGIGVILQAVPEAQIVDLDHTIEKFNLFSAAFVLSKSYRFFPKHTTFICVIDPGVGGARKLLCIETPEYTFIAPDNGLLHYIIRNEPSYRVWYIDDCGMEPQSNTFHGRDLFVPVAIALAQGKRHFLRSCKATACITLKDLDTKDLVVYTDSFGNIKTNVPADRFQKHSVTLSIRGLEHSIPFFERFSECAPDQLLCYRGSNDTLEIAVNLGSARDRLGLKSGDVITLK